MTRRVPGLGTGLWWVTAPRSRRRRRRPPPRRPRASPGRNTLRKGLHYQCRTKSPIPPLRARQALLFLGAPPCRGAWPWRGHLSAVSHSCTEKWLGHRSCGAVVQKSCVSAFMRVHRFLFLLTRRAPAMSYGRAGVKWSGLRLPPRNSWEPYTTLLIPGYAAAGTCG